MCRIRRDPSDDFAGLRGAERFLEDVVRLLDTAQGGGDALERDGGKFLEQRLLHFCREELDLGHLGHDRFHLALVERGEDDRGFLGAEDDEQAGELLRLVQRGNGADLFFFRSGGRHGIWQGGGLKG